MESFLMNAFEKTAAAMYLVLVEKQGVEHDNMKTYSSPQISEVRETLQKEWHINLGPEDRVSVVDLPSKTKLSGGLKALPLSQISYARCGSPAASVDCCN